jgi:hypothetical protein
LSSLLQAESTPQQRDAVISAPPAGRYGEAIPVPAAGIRPGACPDETDAGALAQFFQWLAEEDQLRDPMARLRSPQVREKLVPVFTSEEQIWSVWVQRSGPGAAAGRFLAPQPSAGAGRRVACRVSGNGLRFVRDTVAFLAERGW